MIVLSIRCLSTVRKILCDHMLSMLVYVVILSLRRLQAIKDVSVNRHGSTSISSIFKFIKFSFTLFLIRRVITFVLDVCCLSVTSDLCGRWKMHMACRVDAWLNFSTGVTGLNRSYGIFPSAKRASAASGWHCPAVVIAINR